MQLNDLSGLHQNPLFQAAQQGGPHGAQAAKAADPANGDASRPAAVLGDGSQGVQEAFEGMVYQSKTVRMSLATQLQEVRARVADANGEQVDNAQQAQTRQLTFNFFAEARTEELAVFQQRTDAAAGQLEGQSREQFAAVARQMSMRFSMSIEVSGAALNGFASGAENAADPAGATSLDQFIKLANEAFAETNEVINQLYELMDDFFSGTGDLQDRFNTFLQGLEEIGLVDLSNLTLPGQGGAPQSGQAQTIQAAGVSIQMEFEFMYEEVAVVQEADPLTLDLDGDGIELTNYRDGARFDLTGTGRQVSAAFVTGGDAFLAVDNNGNGRIDSGRELFGDQNGAANGFEELRRFDSNNDGVINRNDDRFDALRLFRDNGNGRTEPGELISLAQGGVTEIGLGYREINEAAAGGNRLAQDSYFARADGTRGRAADAMLNFIA
jgi:hypothetical protein